MSISARVGSLSACTISSIALGVTVITCFSAVVQAHAYKVYTPEVELGVSEVEARLFVNEDDAPAVDGSGGIKVTYGYGFMDFWKTEVYAEVSHQGGDTELTTIAWENIFQLTEPNEYWANLGVLAEVAFAVKDGHPHAFKIGPLIEKSFGRVEATMNLFLEREFGPNDSEETEFSYAARLRWRLNEHWNPALELYGAPGAIDGFESGDEQRHQIGPAVYGEADFGLGFFHGLGYSAAALYGITEVGSPDWTLVFRVESELF